MGVSDGRLSITDRLQNPPGKHTAQDCWPWGGSPMPGHLSSPAPPEGSGGLCFWCSWQVCVGGCGGEGHPGPPRRPFPLFPDLGVGGWLCPTPQLTEGNLGTHLLPQGCGWLQAWGGGKAHVQQSLREGSHALDPPVTRAQPGSPQPLRREGGGFAYPSSAGALGSLKAPLHREQESGAGKGSPCGVGGVGHRSIF